MNNVCVDAPLVQPHVRNAAQHRKHISLVHNELNLKISLVIPGTIAPQLATSRKPSIRNAHLWRDHERSIYSCAFRQYQRSLLLTFCTLEQDCTETSWFHVFRFVYRNTAAPKLPILMFRFTVQRLIRSQYTVHRSKNWNVKLGSSIESMCSWLRSDLLRLLRSHFSAASKYTRNEQDAEKKYKVLDFSSRYSVCQ